MLYTTASKHLQKHEIDPVYTALKNHHSSLKYFEQCSFPHALNSIPNNPFTGYVSHCNNHVCVHTFQHHASYSSRGERLLAICVGFYWDDLDVYSACLCDFVFHIFGYDPKRCQHAAVQRLSYRNSTRYTMLGPILCLRYDRNDSPSLHIDL